MAAHAKAYIRKGWQVVPLWWPRSTEKIDPQTGELTASAVCSCHLGQKCTSVGKHPHSRHGSKNPLKTGLAVDLYWSKYPLCNIGIATGAASGIVVLDIDTDKGGLDSMRRLWSRYGAPKCTPVSITGSGGRHIIFRHPGKGIVYNAVGYMPGIDVRADGGLIVVPPSLHGTGSRYAWHRKAHPRDYRTLEMPTWMRVFCEAARAKRRASFAGRGQYGKQLDAGDIGVIDEGNRNTKLCSIAGRLIWEKRTADDVAQFLREVNRRCCKPPLSDKEVEKLASSAYRRWAVG